MEEENNGDMLFSCYVANLPNMGFNLLAVGAM